MRIDFLSIQHNPPLWFSEVRTEYLKKISGFFPAQAIELKAKRRARDEKHEKLKAESELLLKQIESKDLLILLDEGGKTLDSIGFSKSFERALGSGKRRIVICCGGAYGVTQELKERADLLVSLSPLTFNHLLAQAVIYEQAYRALTIIHKLPYHND